MQILRIIKTGIIAPRIKIKKAATDVAAFLLSQIQKKYLKNELSME
jgi:hypothetical protein